MIYIVSSTENDGNQWKEQYTGFTIGKNQLSLKSNANKGGLT